jgi:hypothetical protein
LISIDPAKRLADALGITLTGDFSPIFAQQLSEEKAIGSVSAAMIDQKQTFDRMVKRFIKDPVSRQTIFDNPFYKSAAEVISGPLEYLALAKLAETLQDPKYDLVVLDTPPATNAVDFLKRPEILAEFVNRRFVQILVKPLALFTKFKIPKSAPGVKAISQLIDFAGLQSVKKLFDFVVLSEGVIAGINQLCAHVSAQMRADSAAYFLITTPSLAGCHELCFLHEHGLEELGIRQFNVLLNRNLSVLPEDQGTHVCGISAKLSSRLQEEVASKALLRAYFSKHKCPISSWLEFPEVSHDLASGTAIWEFSRQISAR